LPAPTERRSRLIRINKYRPSAVRAGQSAEQTALQSERGIEMPHSLRKSNTTLWIVLAVLALAAIAIIIAVTVSGGGGGGGGGGY